MEEKSLKTMRNIKNFCPVDLAGEKVDIPEINKLIGNAVYFSASDLSICETGRAIYAEFDFEVTPQLTESVKNLRNIAPWLVEQLLLFLNK